MVIRRVAPVSCAKIAAVLYAVGGLFVGGVVSLIALAGGFATSAFAADPSRRSLVRGFTTLPRASSVESGSTSSRRDGCVES